MAKIIAKRIELTPNKTYANPANVEKAVQKFTEKYEIPEETVVRYFIEKNEAGRYFPVFVGMKAAECGIHFHFNTLT